MIARTSQYLPAVHRRHYTNHRRGKECEKNRSVAAVGGDRHNDGFTEVNRARDTAGEQPPQRSPGGKPFGRQSKGRTGYRTEQDTNPQAPSHRDNAAHETYQGLVQTRVKPHHRTHERHRAEESR
ncbi:hypothetical protein [Streptomyces sp. NRRL WC-3549]|uniref:hypothetical protein n=1 Tax=Streptomyces sp. NRRL WC-3549 TaxID=1463925 RepID=UPI00131E743B|nr:hypothetical protein [Streptomyces sp. NRRL WC-3549]